MFRMPFYPSGPRKYASTVRLSGLDLRGNLDEYLLQGHRVGPHLQQIRPGSDHSPGKLAPLVAAEGKFYIHLKELSDALFHGFRLAGFDHPGQAGQTLGQILRSAAPEQTE